MPKSSLVAGVVAVGLFVVAPAAASANTPYHHASMSSKATHSNAARYRSQPAPHGKGQPSAKGHRKTHDKLAGPRHAAEQVLTACTKQLVNLSAASTSSALSAEQRASLNSVLQDANTAVASDLSGVATASSVAGLNALKHAGQLVVAAVRLQVSTDLAGATNAAQVTTDQATFTDLQVQVDTAAQAGTDPTSEQQSLDDAQEQLAGADHDLQDATDTADTLDSESSGSDIEDAAARVSQDLAAAHSALQAVAADFADVQSELSGV